MNIDLLKNDFAQAKKDLEAIQANQIHGMDLDEYIFNKIVQRVDPIQYIENVLRAHLPESKRHLHSNQIELVRAVCNPRIRRVAALMARQCLANGTLVRMADGSYKQVEHIVIGDEVMTTRRTAAKVTEVVHGNAPLYEVISKGNFSLGTSHEQHLSSYKVTGNHHLSIYTGDYKEITVEDYLNIYGNTSPYHIYGYYMMSSLGSFIPRFYRFAIIPCEAGDYTGITINEVDNKGKKTYHRILVTRDNIVTHNSGKCLAKGTEVLMSDGRVEKVENIRIGDKVMGVDSHPKEVVQLGKGYSPMYQIKDKHSDSSFTVNSEHILSLIDVSDNVSDNISESGSEVDEIDDDSLPRVVNMSIGDYLKLPEERKKNLYGYRKSINYPHVDTVIDAYTYGTLLGNGISIISLLSSLLSSESYSKASKYVNENIDKKLKEKLQLYEEGKLSEERIDKEYLINDIFTRKKLLAGLIDSQICVLSDDGKYLEMVIFEDDGDDHEHGYSHGLIADITRLVSSLGLKANCHFGTKDDSYRSYVHIFGDLTSFPIKTKEKQIYMNSFFPYTVFASISDIANNTCKTRKTDKVSTNDLIHSRILDGVSLFEFDVVPLGEGEYYGFALSGGLSYLSKGEKQNDVDKLFLLADYTVTHNTESIASFSGVLLDNVPQMRIGIFTPRVQQAEVNVGRLSIFFQMNEDKLNNKIIKCTKQRIELNNGSFISAVSGSDQSNIEGLTFDVIVLDEAQKISNYTWSERISPMGGATNSKLVKIGTPKFRNHFYDSMEGKGSGEWYKIRRDWTQCAQLWALDATMLPDHEDPEHKRIRPYSTYVLGLMPKALKQVYFPTRPDVWTDGEMSVEDFKTQYMLEFVDGAGQFLTVEELQLMKDGDFDWLPHGQIGETYVAGIDFAGSGSDGADFTHITVLRIDERTNQKQKVFALELQGVSYPEQIRVVEEMFAGMTPRFICKSIFADYTGCGRPVVQMLIEHGVPNLTGITFNATDTITKTGMNFKNAMYAYLKQELNYNRFKYPSIDRYTVSAGKDNIGFWHKMIGQWSDLTVEQGLTVNKRIGNPTMNDDTCDADVLANFAAFNNGRRRMPAPVAARMSR